MAESRNIFSTCRRFLSWIQSWIRIFCCAVLKTGKIPTHVAFIMDGNRRFALKMKKERTYGHSLGFTKLTDVLVWCKDLGIKEVTVYAFSIENFKRTKEEVDCLMELVKQKITELLKYRVLGDLHLLSPDVLEAIADVVFLTRQYNSVILNVCFAYTSRAEVTDVIKRMKQATTEGMILSSDISEEVMERCLYTGDSPPPGLLVRTSGEIRLSDFLLWQSAFACICFQKSLWPEYSMWNFFSAILTYQRNFKDLKEARDYMLAQRKLRQYESDKECVLGEQGDLSDLELERRIEVYAAERKKRTDKFIATVRQTRESYLAKFRR